MSAPEMPERIWLIPDIGWDGETAWSNDPAPEPGMDPDNATEYRRSDLCASGQQVRALEWEQVDPTAVLGHGIEPCQYYIRYGVGSWWMPGDAEVEDAQEFDDLEAAKAAAQADYERRILAALTPAPQAEGQDALKISPEYQALFDEVKQRAQPEEDFPQPSRKDGREPCGECRLPAGETCDICGAISRVPAPSAGTPTAQEAVPVGWITDKTLHTLLSETSGIFRINHGKRRGTECPVPIYIHSPQPSETVAEAEIERLTFALAEVEALELQHGAVIARLAEENRRLREALKKIASTGRCEFAEVRAVLRSTGEKG